MNKHFLTIATLGIGLAALISIGGGCWAGSPKSQKIKASKKLIKKDFTVSDFQKIDVSGEGTVVFEQTNGPSSLTIEAPENFFDHLSVKSDDGQLSIEQDHGVIFKGTRKITYHVKSKSLKQVNLTGAVSFEANKIDGDTFSVEAHGFSSICIQNLKAKSLEVELAGSASVSVAGSVEKQKVNLSGAVSYDAKDLESADCEFDASGTFWATVRATKSLTGSASGVGKLSYGGNPSHVDLESSFLTTVRKTK